MFDVFIHMFAVYKTLYGFYNSKCLFFEEACFTMIFEVWIHIFKFMFSYFTGFFKLGSRGEYLL